MIDITQVIVALISLLAGVITAVAIPWVRAKVGEKRYVQLLTVARVVVQAAEQLGATKAISDKLTYAMERAQEALASMGIKFDDKTVRAAIEAEVLAMKTP